MADGLFGPSPWEIQQAQQQAMVQNAAAYAQQSPLERAAAGMYQAGGMLGGMAAGAFGGKNVAVEQAKRQEQIMGQGEDDLGTSAGMATKAEQFRKVGDLRTATALTLKANEMRRQEAAAALAARKQDFQEQDAMEFKRQQLLQQADLKKAELEQRAKDAQLRSEDARYSADQRRAAAAEAAQTRAMIATMMAEVKKASTGGASGKPLTPIQAAKQDKLKAESSAAIRAQDSDIVTLGADIDKVASDPNLSRATGVSDYIWSRPGGAASQIEGQLDSIVNKLKAQGLKVLREGGGIGAITEKEWDILANQVANIDRKKGDVYVKGELEKVKLRMAEMKRNAAQRHAEQFGEEYSASREGGTPPAGGGMPTPDAIAAEIARRRGGK